MISSKYMKSMQNQTNEDTSQIGWTSWLLLACLTVAASASFGFGYGIGGPNQVSRQIDKSLRNIDNRTDSITDELKSGIPQTMFTIANAVGAFTAAKFGLIPRFNNRRTIFYVNYAFYFVSVILVILSSYAKWFWLYLISRLFHGYQGGMACAIVPPYINEISSRKVRGATGTIHQLFITVGILISQIIGLPIILGTDNAWQWTFVIGCIPSIIAIPIIRYLPDSPSDVIGKHNDELKAVESLRKLRGTRDVSKEIENIKAESQAKSGDSEITTLGFMQLIKSSRHRWPLIISMSLLGGQALTGINAVFFYSEKIFKSAGISDLNIPYAVLSTGVINVVATILAIKLMEMWGRRILIIYPGIGLSLVSIVLAITIKVNESSTTTGLSWLIIILIMLYIICFAVGWGPIPFLYCTEVFRQDARDSALVMGLILNYLFNVLLSFTFPALNRAIGGYVFAIFAVITAAQVALFWYKMPETKNKTISQIEAFWSIPAIVSIDEELHDISE
ncbi:hypothetical protein GJ496_010357 [Pomphorhynchus laevis]|nr:hypothetical protein GJ496_010357 [Pomphorhynchus laevis]